MAHETSETVMSFADGNPSFNYTVPSQPDATFDNATTDGATMAEYLQRPVKIHEFEWSSSIVAFSTFLPWKLFFENARVSNRITTYQLLRCKLHLKFLINGTPFQYGRLMADYIPLRSATGPPDELTVDRAFVTQDSVGASQRPHIFLDPTTCAGGEMELPFFWYKDYLNVVAGDWDLMGEINIRQLNALASTNTTSTDTVRITVMAWASEVEVAMPTAFDAAGLTAQALPEYEYQAKTKSKGKGDEYPSSGVISGPATAIQNVASALTKVPFLAPYARASEVAAGAIANIARMFGYSRPVMQTEGIAEYRPVPTGSLALTNIPDNSHKLALDVKQETTVDSRTVGLDGTDEMNIKSIAMRESYVTKFAWTENDSANSGDVPETLLWTSYVTPLMFDVEKIPGSAGPPVVPDRFWYHYTPSGFISNLFASWHGSMIFRFQIVASKFHRGRLRIVYEPGTTTPGNNFDEYNINYSKIVDISEERDVVMKVGHGQDKYWLPIAYPNTVAGDDVPPFSTSVSTFPVMSDVTAINGTISVYVLNDLESPDPGLSGLQDIEINVYTSMGDDFEVMDPAGDNLFRMTFFEPQATPEYEPTDVILRTRTIVESWPLRALYGYVQRQLLKDTVTELPNGSARPLNLNKIEQISQRMRAMSLEEARDIAIMYQLRDEYAHQSSPEMESEGQHTDECAADGNQPVNPEPCDLVPTIVRPEYAMTHPGEAVKSLRSLIKRYDYHRTEGGTTTASARWLRISDCDFPFLRGSAPNAISSSGSPVYNWNFCSLTALNYVMAAFSGWRGGVRWKIIGSNGSNTNVSGVSYSVTRSPIGLQYSNTISNMATFNDYAQDDLTYIRRNWFSFAPLLAASGIIGSKMPGTALSNKATSNTLEFETPYYQRFKFVPKRANYTADVDYVRYHSLFIEDGASTSGPTSYDFYVAAGDDMSGFFFTGLPRVLFLDDPDPDFPV
jgi:hypothetical protein